MKINKIEKNGGNYHVTKTPNFIEKIFGIKEKTELYIYKGEVFVYFPNIKVFYKNDEPLFFCDKMCKILNNYEKPEL